MTSEDVLAVFSRGRAPCLRAFICRRRAAVLPSKRALVLLRSRTCPERLLQALGREAHRGTFGKIDV